MCYEMILLNQTEDFIHFQWRGATSRHNLCAACASVALYTHFDDHVIVCDVPEYVLAEKYIY